jgi:hypothetical protein
MQSEFCSEMLHLDRWQHLGECVGDYVIGGAVNEAQGPLLNDPSDPMIMHINVLGPGMVLVVACEHNG